MAKQEVTAKIMPLRAIGDDGFRSAEWRGRNEREWCEFAMSRSTEWLPVIGIDRLDNYQLEYQVLKVRESGMPRFDAVGWLDGKAYIFEAKVKSTPSELMAGVGQLLYYRTVAENMGWNVARLVLLSPAWPPLFVQTIASNGLPVDVVRLTPDTFTAIRCASVLKNNQDNQDG